jgi:hypothetical protein
MSALRELLEKAERDINTYRAPRIEEAHTWLHNILVAAGLPGINHNSLDHFYIGDEEVFVTSSWSVRSCADSDTYRFPIFIIDAEDPIQAARKWGLEEKLAETQIALDGLRAQALLRARQVVDIEAQLKELS